MWELGSAIFSEAIRSSSFFGNGAVLTAILIVITIIMITRDTSKWGTLSLPIASLYIFVLGTTISFGWATLIISIAAIIWLLTTISPSLSRIAGVNLSNPRTLGKALKVGEKRTQRRKEQQVLKRIIETKKIGLRQKEDIDQIEKRLLQLGSKKGREKIAASDKKQLNEIMVSRIFAKTKKKENERTREKSRTNKQAKNIHEQYQRSRRRLANTPLPSMIDFIDPIKIKKDKLQKKINYDQLRKGKASKLLKQAQLEEKRKKAAKQAKRLLWNRK